MRRGEFPGSEAHVGTLAPILFFAVLLVIAIWLVRAGRHQAETLPTPFPGTVLSAHGSHGACTSDGCPFTVRVRITNPTDREANIQECELEEPNARLYLSGNPAGLTVGAHATVAGTGGGFLPMSSSTADGLEGRALSCTGLDWHGNPPI